MFSELECRHSEWVASCATMGFAAIDVVPNANREIQPAVVRHLDEAIQRGQVALLLFGRYAYHPNIGESIHVEEIEITRREETAVS